MYNKNKINLWKVGDSHVDLVGGTPPRLWLGVCQTHTFVRHSQRASVTMRIETRASDSLLCLSAMASFPKDANKVLTTRRGLNLLVK